MALFPSMRPTSSLLDSPLNLTHPLNTPSGQNHCDYFTAHRDRGVGLQSDQAIIRKGTTRPTVDSFKGSLLDLPNEILSHILELGYFEYDADHTPNHAFRALVSRLSRKLRNLVLQMPSLWSVVQLSFTNIASELDFLPIRLQRSMKYPLTLRLSCYWDMLTTEDIMDKLLPHIDRWEHLSVTITSSHLLTLLEHQPAPFLEYLGISFYAHENHVSVPPHLFGGHLPRLQHLCLRHVDIYNLGFSLRELQTLEIRGYGVWPSYARLNEMLGGSSSLHELILHVNPRQTLSRVFPGQSLDGPLPQILLPELRRMTIYTSEWLSPKIAALIRLFACPKLELLFVHESNSVPTCKPQSIMIYARDVASMLHIRNAQDQLYRSNPMPMPDRFPNHLFLHTCNFYVGCRALPGANLTTLELHRVHWPTHAKLKELFASLGNLVNLFIYDLNPKRAVLSILGGEDSDDDAEAPLSIASLADIQGSIALPRLEHLTIQFNQAGWHAGDSAKFYTAGLFRLFAAPALRALHVKNFIDGAQWKAVVDGFIEGGSGGAQGRCPALTALALTNLADVLPADPADPAYADVAAAFPRLRTLALDGVGSSNALLRQLLPSASLPSPEAEEGCPSDEGGSGLPFPDLRVLEVYNDPYVSKPLLHRVIAAREKAGTPLRMVCLDRYFAANPESLGWIREHVEVVEMRGEVRLIRD